LLQASLAALPDARFDAAIFLRTHQAGFRRFLSIPADAHVHPLDPRMRSTSPYQAPISRWGDVRAHQVLQHFQIVSLLTGRTYSFADVEYPQLRWTDEDARAPALVFGEDVPPAYLVVHPFAKEETRRYPPEYWPALLRVLVDELDVPVVVVGGPEDPPLPQARGLLQTQGRLTLMQTAFLISTASAFVGNLSGPAHLSGALGCPTVTLMGGNSLPVEWAPLGDSFVVRADVPCSPCHRTHCPGYGLACLRALTPERIAPDVLGFLRERLVSPAAAAASPRSG
jgi:ADP-heptose:LPS heptosyltransferase